MTGQQVVRSIPDNVAEQFRHAYHRMAAEARYRPGAPRDGFGHVTVSEAELDMEAETAAYAAQWWAEEDALQFFIGCCNFSTRPATIYLIEAARALCATNDDLARDLIALAADELDGQAKTRFTSVPGA